MNTEYTNAREEGETGGREEVKVFTSFPMKNSLRQGLKNWWHERMFPRGDNDLRATRSQGTEQYTNPRSKEEADTLMARKDAEIKELAESVNSLRVGIEQLQERHVTLCLSARYYLF